MKKLIVLFFSLTCLTASAQEMSKELVNALAKDDATALQTLVNHDNINTCYNNYSLLSQAVRANATKCFTLLLEKGADVNVTCNGYVPPIMHAAKYGRLEMVKALIAKGVKADYIYEGDYGPAQGKTPLTYAEVNHQDKVAEYLRSLKKE